MSGAFSPPTHAPDCLMGMAGQVPAFFFVLLPIIKNSPCLPALGNVKLQQSEHP